jgi:hypothetical protein
MVPAGRDVLQLKFKPERLPQPLFFRDVERTATGFYVSNSKALPLSQVLRFNNKILTNTDNLTNRLVT